LCLPLDTSATTADWFVHRSRIAAIIRPERRMTVHLAGLENRPLIRRSCRRAKLIRP
jgi:hypothetical protein